MTAAEHFTRTQWSGATAKLLAEIAKQEAILSRVKSLESRHLRAAVSLAGHASKRGIPLVPPPPDDVRQAFAPLFASVRRHFTVCELS